MTRTPPLAGLVFLSLCVSSTSNAATDKEKAPPASKATKLLPGSEANSSPGEDLEVNPIFREIERKFQERGAQAEKRIDELLPLFKNTKHPDDQKNFCEILKEEMYYTPMIKTSGRNPLVVRQKDVFAVDFIVRKKSRTAFVLTYGYTDKGGHLIVKLVDAKQAFIELRDATPKGQEIYVFALGCLFTFQQKDPFALKAEPSS